MNLDPPKCLKPVPSKPENLFNGKNLIAIEGVDQTSLLASVLVNLPLTKSKSRPYRRRYNDKVNAAEMTASSLKKQK